MSWTKKNMPPGKIISTSQEVEVMVLDVDASKRRISLGMKQCIPNPWAALQEKYTVGSEIEGEVKNITEFGLFVGLTDDIVAWFICLIFLGISLAKKPSSLIRRE